MSSPPGSREATAGPERDGAEELAPLVLGPTLRPIVLGGLGSLGEGALAQPQVQPEITLSVHSRSGRLLGYVVLDRIVPGSTWGALTASDHLSLLDVRALARITTLQFQLFSIRRGSHHCLASPSEATREEYLDALRPLLERGICTIVVRNEDGEIAPRMAREGVVASATAAAFAALEHLDLDPSSSTVALHGPTSPGREVVGALEEGGLRLVGDGDQTLDRGADIVVASRESWSIGLREASSVRARVVLTLGPTRLTVTAERLLHTRKIVVLPDVLAAAGQFVAVDLRARGLDARTAIERTRTAVALRTKALLESASTTERPLTALLRDGPASPDLVPSPGEGRPPDPEGALLTDPA